MNIVQKFFRFIGLSNINTLSRVFPNKYVNLLDIGARDGLVWPWSQIDRKTLKLTLVEPDRKEADKLMKKYSASVTAIDISNEQVLIAKSLNPELDIVNASATALPYKDNAFDAVFFLEGVYYIKDLDSFFSEVSRVLKEEGGLYFVCPNSDLFDFNPSPFSFRYVSPLNVDRILASNNFSCIEIQGGSPVSFSFVNMFIRLIKWLAVYFGVMPKTMKGKRLLKRVFFAYGRSSKMASSPEHLPTISVSSYLSPIRKGEKCSSHSVLFFSCINRK